MRRLAVGGLLALAAGIAVAAAEEPPHREQARAEIRIDATPLPMDASDLQRTHVGRFYWAGGLELTSRDTNRLHGLSDLKVWPDGRLLAESDEGDLLTARLVLDARGRPAGITDARLVPLLGEDGRELPQMGKDEADAEGVAELANGDRLISLERDDRILLYPAAGGPPRKAPSPPERYPFNLGMEGLAQDPDEGPDAYVVGGEASGQTWVCHLASGCTKSFLVAKDKEQGLSALAVLPHGGRAYLLRSFSLLAGVRVTLRICDHAGATVDELKIATPLAVDNYEGLAALPRPDGSTRFYLISDDNFSRLQHTFLVAFDWRPKGRRARP